MGPCPQPVFGLACLVVLPLECQASTFCSARSALQVMNAPALQPLPVSAPPHWTDPVSREETLARRDKFRNVGWRPPNHKPKTKKVVTYAKNVWERYVTRRGSTFTYVLSWGECLTACS